MLERFEQFRKEKLGSIEFLLFVYTFSAFISTMFAILVRTGILSI
ncbi:hypothetical protein PM10SUCC1_25920 [Propionigenium maris DSM 9537]|uniref:Uncharacterized protein n=1 Tax=Propionigenium maris DSM 9537 TaxID=1123000 RepID=A0A9W6LNY0_9FUSO|nr:hypothetical protein [Propionigenium maris]GLI57078.1 hypothetical protein PM10SUCC1_25920 [Propionigenium maris DSM 9537]